LRGGVFMVLETNNDLLGRESEEGKFVVGEGG
jgi:hypothetical protein